MTRVLIDTSVWINHFRVANQELIELLNNDIALIHPMIAAEIACGTPPSRKNTLSDLESLQKCHQPTLSEVMGFIERKKFFGHGCGIIDMILLASTLITPNTKLWTLDNRLAVLAKQLGILYKPKLH